MWDKDRDFGHWRETGFDSFEERLAFAADALPEVALHALESDFQLESSFEPLAGAVAAAGNAGQGWTDAAWTRSTYGFNGSRQTVAIIDTGIAYNHQSLGNGYGNGSRVVGGWDFAENDANPYDDGPDGFHGTHVAGIVGSSNATYAGVANDVDLVALRVFDDNGSGNFGWIEQALQWVHAHRNDFENPITTVNLSLGTTWNSANVPNWANLEEEFAQLEADGIFISVSAGNSFTTYNAPGLSYPAASSYVVPVMSADSNGSLSSFSQRHTSAIAAPGRQIMSTVPDYLYSNDGIHNDFASASGTSMAAPFVAGASVLMRDAMLAFGYTNITEDAIYERMRATADSVFDSITNASYLRLNLRRAIESLTPADDFGDTAGTAFNMGSLNASGRTLGGTVNTLTDRDYFSFTAASNGTARFTLTGAAGLTGTWAVEGGVTATGNAFSFSVTAGQSYTLRLQSGGGVGTYSFLAQVEPSGWGNVAFYLATNQNATGDQWFQVTASQTGIFTAEAYFNHSAGNIDLEFYSANRTLVASSAGTSNVERTDFNATAGQSYWIRVVGTNAAVTYRCTNLVSMAGNTVTVTGTSGDDLFTLAAGATHRLGVNGVSYDLSGTSLTDIQITGNGGGDTLYAVGTAENETVTFSPGAVSVVANAYRVTGSAEYITVLAGEGNDTATFNDSAGYNAFVATPLQGTMSGEGFINTGAGFDSVNALFSAGGFDQAFLYGSIGDDTFTASPTHASLNGPGFSLNAQGYDTVVSVGGWGNDIARLSDSAGDDIFIGRPDGGSLSNANYFVLAANFERVEARATAGNDIAWLYDSAGDDLFGGSKLFSYYNGAGFSNYAENFDSVVARNTAGGSDTAELYDSLGDDVFTSLGALHRLEGSGYSIQLENQTSVRSFSGNGGRDTAIFQELGAGDATTGRGGWISVTRGTSNVFLNGFREITAVAKSTSKPRSDVQAVDYLFNKSGRWA